MEDRCICCGAVIPEGRQVCQECENSNSSVKGKKMTLDEARMKHLIMRNGGKATERKIEIFRVPQFMSKRVNVICVDGIPFCTVRGKRTTSDIISKLSGYDVTVCDARINKLAEVKIYEN